MKFEFGVKRKEDKPYNYRRKNGSKRKRFVGFLNVLID